MNRHETNERNLWCPPMPESFHNHYRLAGYPEDQVIRIAKKYMIRPENLSRAWVRIHHHFPETTNSSETLDILEFSTAHGAMLEVWRYFGHKVRGTDFGGWPDDYNRNKHDKLIDGVSEESHEFARMPKNLAWVYQPIVESIGVEVDLFDAGVLPYAYEDKSYDIICCYQSLEAYAKPEQWAEIVKEFCRIARQSIVIGFNPPPRELRHDLAHNEAFRSAIEGLRQWKSGGFECAFLEFGRTRAGSHPTAVKLIASAA
jgi:hypothetical protein